MTVFNHSESIYNSRSAKEIVPTLIELINPSSVLDFGCGIGTFLSIFKNYGVDEILGIDGSWVNRSLLYEYIDEKEFLALDLNQQILLEKKYDLVLCLEVAEHLEKASADILIDNLVRAGNVIVFSAAMPNQGGQNHINEQLLTYWEKKFNRHNYIIKDVLRPIFWEDKSVDPWYKQNIILVCPKNYKLDSEQLEMPIRDVIHPELFNRRILELTELNRSIKSPKYYLTGLTYSIFGTNTMTWLMLSLKKLKKLFRQ